MPVNRIVHPVPTNVNIPEPFTRIEKNSGTEIIITDLTISIAGPEPSVIILNKRLCWLRIQNGSITVLNDEPSTLPGTSFQHGDWAMSRLTLKGANLHFIRYNDAAKDLPHRIELVSYEPGDSANDQIIVFINQTNDFCQIYFD